MPRGYPGIVPLTPELRAEKREYQRVWRATHGELPKKKTKRAKPRTTAKVSSRRILKALDRVKSAAAPTPTRMGYGADASPPPMTRVSFNAEAYIGTRPIVITVTIAHED